MIYALVENNLVTNLIWLHPMNADEFPNAVPTNDLPIKIGDTYTDGKFYRDGVEVGRRADDEATEADYISALAELGVQ